MRLRTFVLMAGVVALAMSPVYADSIDGKLVGAAGGWGYGAPGQTATLYGNGVNHGLGGTEYNVCTGIYKLDVKANADTGMAGIDVLFAASQTPDHYLWTFCADVRQDAPTDYVPFTIESPEAAFSSTRATNLRILFASYNSLKDGGWTNDEAAAFQALLWEVLFESDGKPIDPAHGDFTVTALSTGAEAIITGILDKWNTTAPVMAGIDVLHNDTYQDYAVTVRGFGGVPEPLTMLGMVASAGWVGGYIRRKRQLA